MALFREGKMASNIVIFQCYVLIVYPPFDTNKCKPITDIHFFALVSYALAANVWCSVNLIHDSSHKGWGREGNEWGTFVMFPTCRKIHSL